MWLSPLQDEHHARCRRGLKTARMCLQRSEHRAVPCAPSGHVVRYPRHSGLQTGWTKRLKIYVPSLAMVLWSAHIGLAQSDPEVRRALPLDQPPVKRALPADDSIDKVLRSLKDQQTESQARETEGADQR